jgi:undecaprenyl pyrophosphate synthase
MSTGPETGDWIELTCDGNRRAQTDVLAETGKIVKPAELDEELAYACYKMGGDASKKIVEAARDNMVGLLALWVWSTKNWDRPEAQQKAVFQVTHEFLNDLETNWIDLPENEDVRLVHMGREERLHREAPDMMAVFDRITEYTKHRKGMVVSLLMDHSGPDEEARARHLWKFGGGTLGFEDHLDLPRLGVPYKHLDLRIRTGETDRIKHTNAVMSGYTGMETRDVFHDVLLPDFTPELFLKDLADYRKSDKRNGK